MPSGPETQFRERTALARQRATLAFTLIAAMLLTHTHEWLRTEQHDRWLGFARPDIASWFLDAGLEDVTVGDTQEKCCPTSNCGTQASISIFLARGRKPLA